MASHSRVFAAGMAALLLVAAVPAQDSRPADQRSTKEIRRFRARHILITWKGAAAAGPETKLTKEEALKKAENLLAQLKGGADLATLARTESVCNSRYAGGDLGQFRKGTMYEQFEAAVDRCKVGEFVGPVETPLGYHVIQRLKIDKVWPPKIAASHILIAFKGAERAPESVTRSKAEARLLATKIISQIKKGETDFTEAAKEHSDDVTTRERGGVIGTLSSERLLPSLVDGLAALEAGVPGGPVETQFGFHVLRRDKLAEPLRASHILIPWKGAARAPSDVTRTKEEARELAQQILEKASKGENFGGLAKRYSSCPSRLRGGDLNEFQRGQMVRPFEEAVLKTEVGKFVGPVETQFGFHVIWRTK